MNQQRKVGTFPTSGLPNYLEWYACYDDPARSRYIDGMELLQHPEWDESTRLKWHFFYRPVAGAVGRPQKKRIRNEKNWIAHGPTWIVCSLITTVLVLALRWWSQQAGMPCLFALVAMFSWPVGIAGLTLAAIVALRISSARERISALEEEIRELCSQIPSPPEDEWVREQLRNEIKKMGRKALPEIIGGSLDSPASTEVVRLSLGKVQEGVLEQGLLVKGWGAIQPMTIAGPAGSEGTGLRSVIEQLGASVATCRFDSKDDPICRVLYLQFIFPLESNLSVYSLFYDSVTTERYGRRSDGFQYSLVTNYYVRQVEPDEPEWLRTVEFPQSIFSTLKVSTEALVLVSASGTTIRCVLTGRRIRRAMKQWFDYVYVLEKLEELRKEKGGQHSDPTLRENLERRKAELERLRDETESRKAEFEDKDLHDAQKVLQSIRAAIESSQARHPGGR